MSIDQASVNAEDLLHDDNNLLADKLLRSLHRNKSGHLASSHNTHKSECAESHNVAVLYCYTFEDDLYTLHYHYVHSSEPLTLSQWTSLAMSEARSLNRNSGHNFYGVYGWLTAYIQITPLRNGDLFIKVDEEGARGVRLSFNTRKANNAARKKTKHSR
jgi:hypothetical protein